MELTQKEQTARNRVCLALDVSNTQEAIRLGSELTDYVGMFKIGKELAVTALNEGVPIIGMIYATNHQERGNVFLDLKFHDTPNTVFSAAKAAAVPGIYMFDIHLAGGEAMCKKAIEGAQEGAQKNGLEYRPLVIGVTELTSLDDTDIAEQFPEIEKDGSYDRLVRRRTELARKWGIDGVVCPASKAGKLQEEFGPDFLYVTPGIQWAGISREGQKQLYTPDRAIRDCNNSILVIGGAVTTAGNRYETVDGQKRLVSPGTREERRKTSYEIIQAMAAEL